MRGGGVESEYTRDRIEYRAWSNAEEVQPYFKK